MTFVSHFLSLSLYLLAKTHQRISQDSYCKLVSLTLPLFPDPPRRRSHPCNFQLRSSQNLKVSFLLDQLSGLPHAYFQTATHRVWSTTWSPRALCSITPNGCPNITSSVASTLDQKSRYNFTRSLSQGCNSSKTITSITSEKLNFTKINRKH